MRYGCPDRVTRYSAYIFDIDGTLLYPSGAVPGAAECLRALRCANKRVAAVTNNTSLTRGEIRRRLAHCGLSIGEKEIFSVIVAAAALIAREHPGARVHVFGNPSPWIELARFGLDPTDQTEGIDYLVTGNNHSVNFQAVAAALDTLRNGAKWLALNEDRTYVDDGGRDRPGAGVWVSALAWASGSGPDRILGKPSPGLLQEAAAALDCPAPDCLYIGDNLEVDVPAAHAAGMEAALVLTGVTRQLDDTSPGPEHVLGNLSELAHALREVCRTASQ